MTVDTQVIWEQLTPRNPWTDFAISEQISEFSEKRTPGTLMDLMKETPLPPGRKRPQGRSRQQS